MTGVVTPALVAALTVLVNDQAEKVIETYVPSESERPSSGSTRRSPEPPLLTTADDLPQTITVDDHGRTFHLTALYLATNRYGVRRPKYRAYQKVFVSSIVHHAAPGGNESAPWYEEDPKTFKDGPG